MTLRDFLLSFIICVGKVPSQCKQNAIVKEKINPGFLLSQVFLNAPGRFSRYNALAVWVLHVRHELNAIGVTTFFGAALQLW